jgi:hypothetical protein
MLKRPPYARSGRFLQREEWKYGNLGSPQYLFTGDGATGKIYKMDLSGKVLGWGQASLRRGADNTGDLVHMLTSPDANTVFIGPASLWDVEKVTIQG